ncbi:hypothetical protein B0A49_09345 [Cryomyces minteri]|uniref:DNA repair protein XRCC4 n=2 Tax=Cryomyces minteri TaxID=331657 RepID=A0A4U0X6Y0_9PEZI|nr:hypothetical protein B0A49_09345 [Cryomyces minteri]
MAQGRVLRIRRTDAGYDSFVLVNVANNGSQPLDLKLSNKTALSAIFLQEQTSLQDVKSLEGLEAVSSISEKAGLKQIAITLRKNISGITQRLGTVTLDQHNEQEIALFDWCGLAAHTATAANADAVALTARCDALQEAIAQLTTQLDDLVTAKKEHEDALIAKFAELLNAKKLKIRDQQRLLAGVKLDPVTVRNSSTRTSAKSRKAGPSRAGKRKANGNAPVGESDSESAPDEDGKLQADVEDEHHGAMTPEKSDAGETEDEDEDEGAFAPAPAASQVSRGGVRSQNSQSRAVDVTPTNGKDAGDTARGTTTAVEEMPEAPPRRELPFSKSKLGIGATKPATQTRPAPAEEDETDDEL